MTIDAGEILGPWGIMDTSAMLAAEANEVKGIELVDA